MSTEWLKNLWITLRAIYLVNWSAFWTLPEASTQKHVNYFVPLTTHRERRQTCHQRQKTCGKRCQAQKKTAAKSTCKWLIIFYPRFFLIPIQHLLNLPTFPQSWTTLTASNQTIGVTDSKTNSKRRCTFASTTSECFFWSENTIVFVSFFHSKKIKLTWSILPF